jgi:hypothetical protein
MAPHTAAAIIFHFGGRRKRRNTMWLASGAGSHATSLFSPQNGSLLCFTNESFWLGPEERCEAARSLIWVPSLAH